MTSVLHRFRPYLSYLRPHWRQVGYALGCGLITGLATGLGFPFLLKYVLPAFFQAHNLSTSELVFLASLPFWVALVRGTSGFGQQYYTGYCGQKILERLRVRIFDHLQRLQLSFFHNRPAGDLISRAMTDTVVLQMSLIEFALNGVRQPFTLIGAVASLTWLCVQKKSLAFLMIFIVVVPLVALPIRFLGRRLRKKANIFQQQMGILTQRLSQSLAATKEIRSFCLEDRELARFDQAAVETSRSFLKVVKYNVFVSPVIEVIATIGIGLALVYAYHVNISWNDVVVLGGTFYICYDPIKRIGDLNSRVQQGLAALDRIEALLREPITINDPEKPVEIGRLRGLIEFRGVTFGYVNENVLHDVNLTIAAGETYAIVGASGAGKTTFVSLLPRFFDVTEGAILIDGHDVRSLRLCDLRRNIAVVPQDPVLFNDTVYNNILVGRINATRDEVVAAAQKAHAHEFIAELPRGYDTAVGDGGAGLSGGQKQRLAIARAFLKDAPILIFDEATSSLDSLSERAIQLALEDLMAGRTVLIVAHRRSSFKHVRHILVFERGRVVEHGSHEELAQLGGVYADLYDPQAP
jgi:ATP-binding cassette, subfamily B, bacterial MsbA